MTSTSQFNLESAPIRILKQGPGLVPGPARTRARVEVLQALSDKTTSRAQEPLEEQTRPRPRARAQTRPGPGLCTWFSKATLFGGAGNSTFLVFGSALPRVVTPNPDPLLCPKHPRHTSY